ncbi:MAG: hypothetical protein WCX71_00170 [Candidatus Buchananbacteria bacterium]
MAERYEELTAQETFEAKKQDQSPKPKEKKDARATLNSWSELVNKIDSLANNGEEDLQSLSGLMAELESRQSEVREIFIGFNEDKRYARSEFRNRILEILIRLANCSKLHEQDDDWKKVKDFSLDMIVDLRGEIDFALSNQEIFDEFNVLKAYYQVAEDRSNEKRSDIGVEALTDNFGLIRRYLSQELTPKMHEAVEIIKPVFKYGFGYKYQSAANEVGLLAKRLRPGGEDDYSTDVEYIDAWEHYTEITSSLFERSEAFQSEAMTNGIEELDYILSDYNLSGRDFFRAWDLSDRRGDLSEVIRNNLNAVRALEETKPGVCQFLNQEFNIADFARYPNDLLIRQYEEADSLDKPYGVIIYPRSDHNGAFYNDCEVLKSLYDQVEKDLSLRVAECSGKLDFVRTLIKFDRRYNSSDQSGHKISLAIIGGHGTKDSIKFGRYNFFKPGSPEQERWSITTDDLTGQTAAGATKFFEKMPTIILSSCSTGAENGIGQKLSEVLGAKVIAPKEPTSIRSIKAKKNHTTGRYLFAVDYIKSKRGFYKAGMPSSLE